MDKAGNVNVNLDFYSDPAIDIFMFCISLISLEILLQWMSIYIYLDYILIFEGNCAITAELPKISITDILK